ncbi:formyl-CoA transferase [Caballeronia catudaia]|uniref:Formyl-CoA transferase n=1 Tax=Caballeronia catudaia TaxID=1777136 RepID=A0A158DE57_9BURK|nr:CoA transferase [Caballeronia catudaia]SAK92912.1 formyl-CoA transferase [Caballeronia catudaia]
MLRQSLEGIKVVDFSQIGAGPTCSMYLGDLGADVVKIEPATGDVGRMLGPPWVDETESAVFVGFNRNKRSIVLDLKSETGLQIARRLISTADVVVESFRPGVMSRFALDYESVRESNPRIVYCSVSAYGSTGDYASKAGVDGILQAASGLMMLLGDNGDAPSKVQAPIVDVSTGYIATIAVLSQLFKRHRTGIGGYLDVSLFASALAIQQSSITGFLGDKALPTRTGSAAPYSAPNEAFQASDGWVMVAAYLGDRWSRLCNILGLPRLIDDPRFVTSSLRVVNRSAMRAELSAAFMAQRCAHWLALFDANDILCSKVCTYEDVMENPALQHMGLIATMETEDGRTFRVPGFPVNSRESQATPHRPPPSLGQHTAEILGELGYTAIEVERLMNEGVTKS